MRKSKKAALIIVMSSVYLAGCNAAGGNAAADPSAAVTVSQEVIEAEPGTIAPEILEAIENITVDVQGYYITTDIRSSGEKTEKERDKEYKGFLQEIEVVEQAGEIVTVKAYLVDSEDFFTTAEKVELEYNMKDSSIQVKADPIRIEPTVFFDTNMFFENKINAANNNRVLEDLPEMTEENIKSIILLEETEDYGVTINDFYFNGRVEITDIEDQVFQCTFYLTYKPYDEKYSFTRTKMEEKQSPIWQMELVRVKKIE